MSMKRGKEVTEALCTVLSGAALFFQFPFWSSLLLSGEISDGVFRCYLYSIVFLATTFFVLAVYNMFRFAYWMLSWEMKQGRTHA